MGAVMTVYGRLGKAPKSIPTRTDTLMVSASIAVDTSSERNPDSTTWINLIAFGKSAELLQACEPGEMVSALGRVQVNRWEREGQAVEQLQIVVDNLHSARTIRARPKPRSKVAYLEALSTRSR